jgi:hypothetical protein
MIEQPTVLLIVEFGGNVEEAAAEYLKTKY